MILLDTSVIIDILRGDLKVSEIDYSETEFATCFPIQCELFKGTRIARNTEKGEKEVSKLLNQLEKLESDKRSAKEFADMTQKYQDINEFDLMIASICKSHNTKILTQDTDFKEIDEIEVEII